MNVVKGGCRAPRGCSVGIDDERKWLFQEEDGARRGQRWTRLLRYFEQLRWLQTAAAENTAAHRCLGPESESFEEKSRLLQLLKSDAGDMLRQSMYCALNVLQCAGADLSWEAIGDVIGL